MSSSHLRSRLLAVALAVVVSHPYSSQALSFWSGGDEKNSGAVESDATASNEPQDGTEYGVDVSFPIHHWFVEDKATNVLGDRQSFYDEFLAGCRERYPGRACDQTEKDRVAMSIRQPASMENYTDVGFKKIRAPGNVYQMLKDFWDKNGDNRTPEGWPKGNTYTNHWSAPTQMVSVENNRLRGGGYTLKKAIWDAARDTMQEWTGQELTECSLYGIRVYNEGAVLATHVDRMPLVSSAIINVAQDVDEPWPIEVYGHDGKATNVTMEPGDMVLYESHSVLHGRPFPLKGRFYANVFIHFEPTGHSLRHNAREQGGDDIDVHEKYRRAAEKGTGGHEAEHSDGLPPYIKEGSVEAVSWRRSHPTPGKASRPKSFATGSTATVAHAIAKKGDAEELGKILEKKKHLVDAEDENGWTPLHEGARGGHKAVVKLLVEKGSDVNKRTNNGSGGTALWLAIEEYGEKHPIAEFLRSVGAVSIEPEL